jgi:hypothetical protein
MPTIFELRREVIPQEIDAVYLIDATFTLGGGSVYWTIVIRSQS